METPKLEPGAELSLDERGVAPIWVHIRVAKSNVLPGTARAGEKRETDLERALRMVGEVKKVHPNAKIHVEVEV